MVWQAVGAIGSSLLGGLFGSSGAKKQNQAQIQAAREQMDFQERMSNTAHQREIKDLEAAGLNPILSAKLGGASSPSGAQPNIVNEMAPMENAARSMGDKLYNYNVQKEQVSNMKLQNNLLKEQIRSAEISNARSGLLTPGFELGGKVIEKLAGKIAPWLEGGTDKVLADGPDIIQEVIDKAGVPTGILPAIPTGYQLDRFVPDLSKSEAAKYYHGKKSFRESLRDASQASLDAHSARKLSERQETYRQRYELTPERLKAYGIKNLDDIRRRAGR